MEGFDFGSPDTVNILTGKLFPLKYCQELKLIPEFFPEAMERLRNEYLNIALEDVYIHPLSAESKNITEAIIPST